MRHAITVLALSLTVAGCGSAPTYTLYRNSGLDRSARIHWATFNAHESDPQYNEANCGMAARLLNANMKRLNGDNYDPSEGFWCEKGSYSAKGNTPSSFAAEYPADT